jgi:AcrR family transcriptional regulator
MVSHSDAEISLIWERAEPVPRGPMAAPDRAHITQAAFEIADREGLHAVSVKRVASKLRVPSVRIEGYVTSRDDLLDLMLDAAFGEIEPAEDGEDWRSKLRAVAYATQVTAQRHPWLRTLAGTRTPCGPNGLRHSERALAAIDGLGLDAATMTQAVNAVLAYVYGFVQLELLEPSRKLDEDGELKRRNHTASYLMQQVSTGDYPTLARVFSGASNLTATDAFETGLNFVLDGIAMHAASRPEPAASGDTAMGTVATATPGEDGADGAGAEEPGDQAADEPGDQSVVHERATGHLRRGRRRATT